MSWTMYICEVKKAWNAMRWYEGPYILLDIFEKPMKSQKYLGFFLMYSSVVVMFQVFVLHSNTFDGQLGFLKVRISSAHSCLPRIAH